MYCFGCNERFAEPTEDSVCPQCGNHVEIDDVDLDETMLMRGEDDGPLNAEGHGVQGELQHLVGETLHVYRCDKLIGRGGMGHVFLAHHRDLHRQCALKILSPKIANRDRDYVKRFQHEGRSAAALVHQHIVTIHAIGECDTFHFLEMEYISGQSLQHLINIERTVTPVRATSLMAGVAAGLSEAHRMGILHRDLKLDNILLSSSGVPKIADFGLAKRVLVDIGDDPLMSYLVGTPSYMAPELFHGLPSSPAADVYALGVCYFVLLTGRPPYTGNSLNELIGAVNHSEIPSVRELVDDVPLEMAECIDRMLSKTPENRPKDGLEAMHLLTAILGEIRDIESLLAAAFPIRDRVRWTRDGARYELIVDLPAGRHQRVIIETSSHKAADRLLEIYSTCCESQPAYFEEALKLNSQISHGGIAIREVDGRQQFVMTNSYPRATVDAEEVRESVIEIATHADAVEKLLTGLDRH